MKNSQTLFSTALMNSRSTRLSKQGKGRLVHCLRQKIQMRDRLDRFADLLADGVPPRCAAESIGMAAGSGDYMLKKLRVGLGHQALFDCTPSVCHCLEVVK